jgi:hypothetical protein
MNQRADSWKENIQLIVAKPLIYLVRWLLSHTSRRGAREQNESWGSRPFEPGIVRSCWPAWRVFSAFAI